eukprot:SAG31_NODE_2540_length_5538_cov_7.680859_3_plen_948_part_00
MLNARRRTIIVMALILAAALLPSPSRAQRSPGSEVCVDVRPADEGGPQCDFETLLVTMREFLVAPTSLENNSSLLASFCACDHALRVIDASLPQPIGDIEVVGSCNEPSHTVLVEGATFAPGTTIQLALSEASMLATLTYVGRVGDEIAAARSYDGHQWELYVSSQPAASLVVNCDDHTSSCTLEFPGGLDGIFRLNLYTTPPQSANETASLLLMQASFGPSRASLFEFFNITHLSSGRRLQSASSIWNSNGVGETQIHGWIADQMSRPPTLHRAFYRERASVRTQTDLYVGRVQPPCEVGSWWHRYAFTRDDHGKTVEGYIHAPSGELILTIDSIPRSIGNSSLLSLPFVICSVDETVGGTVTVGGACSTPTATIANPAINFTGVSSELNDAMLHVLPNSEATLVVVPDRADASVLTVVPPSCTLQNGAAAFIEHEGSFYKHDRRLQLLENTVHRPAMNLSGGPGATFAETACPTVKKSFLNKGGCRRSRTCAPTAYSSTTLVLDETTLRDFYTVAGKYVYYIDGLRLDDPTINPISPCSGVSRWRRAVGPCSNETPLDSETLTTLMAAFQATTSLYNSSWARDVEVTSGPCTTQREGVSVIGASITGPDLHCYTHTHPDNFNVYEFSYWATAHRGNAVASENGRPNPIRRWAEDGSAHLFFPSHHLMNRWSRIDDRFTFIGALGEAVDFSSLPPNVQTPEMAAHFGAMKTDGGFAESETCGSPGEVPNKPLLGNKYPIYTAEADVAFENILQADITSPVQWNDIKSSIWTNAILNAPDQFRQRMAWALSQIYVLGFEGFDRRNIECWMMYYDIFVRNAFTNLRYVKLNAFTNIRVCKCLKTSSDVFKMFLRDVLREVAFSPAMGVYLTFKGSNAYFVRRTYPDENFAREIMQLFTIGLWELEEDGSKRLGTDGQPVPTYDNENIISFARAWTGFVRPLCLHIQIH